jgi:hypothetical protein
MRRKRTESDGSFIEDDEANVAKAQPDTEVTKPHPKPKATKVLSQRRGQWSPAEKQAVSQINKILKREDGCHQQVGEHVDKVINERGGNGYGEETIESLAKHPGLNCSGEHLRRCWHYFQLMRDHEDAIKEVAPTRRYSHLYQISRLYRIEDEEKRTEAILGTAKKAEDEGLTVTALRQTVTTHLKSLKKCVRQRPTQNNEGGDGSKGKPDPYAAFPCTVDTLTEAVDAIAEHPAELADHAGDMNRMVNRLGAVYSKLIGLLLDSGEWDEMSPSVKAVAAELQKLCERYDEAKSAGGREVE